MIKRIEVDKEDMRRARDDCETELSNAKRKKDTKKDQLDVVSEEASKVTSQYTLIKDEVKEL